MNRRFSVVFLICAAILMSIGTAHADTFQVNFTATAFNSFPPGPVAPQDPVSGSFVFEAASATSPVTALDSVNLTIAGHTYTLGEVSFESPFGPQTLIGGTLDGVGVINPGTNDFWLRWITATDAPFDFFYSTAGIMASFQSQTFQSFSITPAASVPEPASLFLFGSGALGLLGIIRRKLAR